MKSMRSALAALAVAMTVLLPASAALAQRLPPAPPLPQTRLLVTFATNQAGFDTGIAINNTGRDSTGDIGQAGRCTIYYFGNVGGGPAPAPQTTSADVTSGGQLVFTLSSGGNLGITGAPGFQGYLEIVCAFNFAHGFAFMSDIGATKFGASPAVIVLPPIRTAPESAGQ